MNLVEFAHSGRSGGQARSPAIAQSPTAALRTSRSASPFVFRVRRQAREALRPLVFHLMIDLKPCYAWHMFMIEDEAHADQLSQFATREAATAELRRLSELPWNEAPNVAPCSSWRTCGRKYEIVEYDAESTPWREVSREPALNVSAEKVEWLLG